MLCPERPNFPKEEEGIVQFWKEIDAFQESLRQSLGKPEFTFYDGPPFATGLPHYGHILAGTIKDVITRHFHQRGFHVDRRFGWDCHGVPVEGIIDKKLNIRGRADVLEMGMDKYNEECRSGGFLKCARSIFVVSAQVFETGYPKVSRADVHQRVAANH